LREVKFRNAWTARTTQDAEAVSALLSAWANNDAVTAAPKSDA
jgi:hypothetical protein